MRKSSVSCNKYVWCDSMKIWLNACNAKYNKKEITFGRYAFTDSRFKAK